MAIWQVSFIFLPKSLAIEKDEIPEKIFLSHLDAIDGPLPYALPPDYAIQLGEILPPRKGWCPNMQVWGNEKADDIQVWRDKGNIVSVDLRIDVRKLDNELLSRVLALAENWSCVLVETRYRKVCGMGLQQFRAFIAGHPHSRAMKDPESWLPFLAEEVKKE